ncbi:MAG: tRNA epoxyqueuosine(34) reductase QueG [Chloroflexi bacterium]|nr:tRNA epoxyqueuosine(34) reductase QueG [Chloroflexota bacterium]
MDKRTLTKQLKGKAQELGFNAVGVTDPSPPPHLDVYRRWLEAGRHGEMGYLASARAVERRTDPCRILPECQSILVLGIPYGGPAATQRPVAGMGRVAAYAKGEDYHEVLKPRLKALVSYLEGLAGHPIANRWYTDSGPIMERELAQRAGLGWIGKNTMLINLQRGSYFLLSEILLGIELDFDAPITTDHCGTCTRCIEACPTDCILEDRTLDASRCISYLTIELKGPVPENLRPQIGNWIFGCDICQSVCPWNERFATPESDPAFMPKSEAVNLEEEFQRSTQEFNRKFKNSPVKRAKRRGYLRNTAIALGNTGGPDAVPALAKTLNKEKEPLVRSHAAWALGQIGNQLARKALKQAAALEKDRLVLEEIQAALKQRFN